MIDQNNKEITVHGKILEGIDLKANVQNYEMILSCETVDVPLVTESGDHRWGGSPRPFLDMCISGFDGDVHDERSSNVYQNHPSTDILSRREAQSSGPGLSMGVACISTYRFLF